MPLLTPLQSINAQLAQEARQCANHLASSAVIANRMVSAMLNMDDETLTIWLNSQPPEDTLALFSAHGQLGGAINTASTIARDVLANSSIAANIPEVDVSSVTEKLAQANRVLSFVDGVFSVAPPVSGYNAWGELLVESELDPEPEPELEEQPEP